MTNAVKKADLYTDGACSGNPGKGGWAWALVVDNVVVLKGSGGEHVTTNNRMELSAVIFGLETLGQNGYANSAVSIHTDSTYVQQGITSWIKKWKKNGWKTANKTPVKNQDLWQRLDALQSNFVISWFWVKGHAENTYNNLCDTLAVKAIPTD